MPYLARSGITSHLAFAVAAAVLGSSFQHGYNTGVLNNPQSTIQEWINETTYDRTGEYLTQDQVDLIWSVPVSLFCVGGMIGGLLTALIADRFGRKKGLLLNNINVFIAAIFMGFSKLAGSYEMIIVGRLFIGISAGLNAGLTPMYLSEISPPHLRGAIGTTYQLVITISILVSNLLGLPQCLGTEDRWPLLLGLTIVPAIFQLATLPICPESPKYLLVNEGHDVQAQKALIWLRGTLEIHDEMDEMTAEAETLKVIPKVTLKELFLNPTLRIPLVISVVVMLSQQLSGINAVIFFSTEIFKSAGLSVQVALYATLGMGAINVFMTMVSLVLVEKAGRRTLQLIGLGGIFFATVLLTVFLALKSYATWLSYVSIVLVFIFVIMFATGPGSIPWFLVAELTNQSSRSLATSIAVGVNWGANFLVTLTFLPLKNAMDEYVFLIFAGLLAFFWVYTYKQVPETKNKNSDEISALFREKAYK
uniref:Solute carrier family 2, facilitated glucose transporter member 1 n=1 Tax=Hemiscolopendra marginata TaxID=943146 RepID=A0A646QID7_9MYRI